MYFILNYPVRIIFGFPMQGQSTMLELKRRILRKKIIRQVRPVFNAYL